MRKGKSSRANLKKKKLGFSHQASKKTQKLGCLGKNADSKNIEVQRLIFKSKGIDLTWNTYKSKMNLKILCITVYHEDCVVSKIEGQEVKGNQDTSWVMFITVLWST